MSHTLPVHESSLLWEEGKEVVIDNTTWLEVQTNTGSYGFHAGRRDETMIARNEFGTEVLVLRNYHNFVTAENEDGDRVIFTSVEAAKVNEFEFSIRLNKFVKKNHTGFFGDEILLNYHDCRALNNESSLPQFHNNTDEYLIGLEVEKVDYTLQQQGKAFEILQETGWRKEMDGSLSYGGYELVSPKLPLMDNARIEQACVPVIDYINGSTDSSCGGHINISKRGVSSDKLLRNMRGIVPLMYAMYERRLNNRYCSARSWSKYFGRYKTKYSAFYLKNDNILEIRLFSAVKDSTTLMWRVKLLQSFASLYGKNVSSVLLKMADSESELYKLLNEVYTRSQIADKIREAYRYSRIYNVAKIKNEVVDKINNKWGECVIDLN